MQNCVLDGWHMINSIIEGDNKMLLEGLKELKEQKKMTNQELADLSGVPLGTINRIMAGQTDNPSFQTVCDITRALGGSLDKIAGLNPEGEREKPVSTEITALYREVLKSKDKWIHRLFVVCCVLIVYVLVLLVFDLANPNIGFFRR